MKIVCQITLLSLLCLLTTISPAQSISTITESANQFLTTLSADELAKTQYAFTDSLRYKWTNLPVGLVPRPGIAYGSLSDASRMAFHRVLSAMLSSQGYLKTTSIMRLDDILNTLYQDAFDAGKIDRKMLDMTQGLKMGARQLLHLSLGQTANRPALGLEFWRASLSPEPDLRRKSGVDVALFCRHRSSGSEVG